MNNLCYNEFNNFKVEESIMQTPDILNYLNHYGPIVIFIIIFLESLNLTGIPAIIILPTVGFFIEHSSYSFLFVYFVTVVGSISGCLLYYVVARKFGRPLYNFFYHKIPATQRSLEKASQLSERYGAMTCFIGRILPTVRTFISLMSGIFAIPFKTFTIYSAAGIAIWNFVTLFIGYLAAIYS